MFLAAAAQRTQRARLITGAVLPAFNHPLKLPGEIAMLDALSHGRLDVGFARAFLIVRRAMYAIMDDPVLDGFGFPKPAPTMRKLVHAALRARALLLRIMPARRHPRLRTEMRHRSYPHGYRIEELGPAVEQRSI